MQTSLRNHLRRASSTIGAAILLSLANSCENVTDVPDRDYLIEAVAGGTGQTAVVASILPEAPAVRVTTADGKPVRGVTVAFAVTSGYGSLGTTEAITGDDGIASSERWTLGSKSGTQSVIAILPQVTNGSEFTFTATATPGGAAVMTVTPTTIGLNVGDSTTLTVVFRDVYLNPTTPAGTTVFTSTDTTVARVTSTGVVIGVDNGDATISVTNFALHKTVHAIVGSGGSVPSLTRTDFSAAIGSGFAISVNGIAYISHPSADYMARFDVRIGSLGTAVHLSNVSVDVAFVPSGDIAYVATYPSHITVVDASTNQALRTIPMPGFPLRVVADPSGAFMYITTENGLLIKLSTANDTFASVSTGMAMNGLALDATNGFLYASSPAGTIFRRNAATLADAGSVVVNGTPQGIAISPDGTRLYVGREDNSLLVRNASDLAPIPVAGAPDNVYAVILTADGQNLVVTSMATGTAKVYDADTMILIETYFVSNVRRLARDPIGGNIWISTDSPLFVRLQFP